MDFSDTDWSRTLTPGERLILQDSNFSLRKIETILMIGVVVVVSGYSYMKSSMFAALSTLCGGALASFFVFFPSVSYALTTKQLIVMTKWPGQQPKTRIIPISASKAEVDNEDGTLFITAYSGKTYAVRSIGKVRAGRLSFEINRLELPPELNSGNTQ